MSTSRFRAFAVVVALTVVPAWRVEAATPIFQLDTDEASYTRVFRVDPVTGTLRLLGTVPIERGVILNLAAADERTLYAVTQPGELLQMTLSPEGGPCGPVDCNDDQARVHPGVSDTCNGIDDDCDGTVDEEPLASASCAAPCLASAQCVSGSCRTTPVVCGALDQCHDAGRCNPATGPCSNPSKADGTACADGNACTLGDTCQSGECRKGALKNCSGLGIFDPRCRPSDGACCGRLGTKKGKNVCIIRVGAPRPALRRFAASRRFPEGAAGLGLRERHLILQSVEPR